MKRRVAKKILFNASGYSRDQVRVASRRLYTMGIDWASGKTETGRFSGAVQHESIKPKQGYMVVTEADTIVSNPAITVEHAKSFHSRTGMAPSQLPGAIFESVVDFYSDNKCAGADPHDYSGLTIPKLKAEAKIRGLAGYSTMNGQELAKLLHDDDVRDAVEATNQDA